MRDPSVGDDFYYDETGDGLEDEDPGDECGRWDNGKLGGSCSLAGTEWCDFECPYRG